jgi:hypothetical protein
METMALEPEEKIEVASAIKEALTKSQMPFIPQQDFVVANLAIEKPPESVPADLHNNVQPQVTTQIAFSEALDTSPLNSLPSQEVVDTESFVAFFTDPLPVPSEPEPEQAEVVREAEVRDAESMRNAAFEGLLMNILEEQQGQEQPPETSSAAHVVEVLMAPCKLENSKSEVRLSKKEVNFLVGFVDDLKLCANPEKKKKKKKKEEVLEETPVPGPSGTTPIPIPDPESQSNPRTSERPKLKSKAGQLKPVPQKPDSTPQQSEPVKQQSAESVAVSCEPVRPQPESAPLKKHRVGRKPKAEPLKSQDTEESKPVPQQPEPVAPNPEEAVRSKPVREHRGRRKPKAEPVKSQDLEEQKPVMQQQPEPVPQQPEPVTQQQPEPVSSKPKAVPLKAKRVRREREPKPEREVKPKAVDEPEPEPGTLTPAPDENSEQIEGQKQVSRYFLNLGQDLSHLIGRTSSGVNRLSPGRFLRDSIPGSKDM